MIAVAQSVNVIYAARFLCGIGLGAVGTISPIYVLEIAETRIRGNLLSLKCDIFIRFLHQYFFQVSLDLILI